MIQMRQQRIKMLNSILVSQNPDPPITFVAKSIPFMIELICPRAHKNILLECSIASSHSAVGTVVLQHEYILRGAQLSKTYSA